MDGRAGRAVAAERQREKVEGIEYGRTVQMAYQQWRENDITAALGLLNGTRPDLRGGSGAMSSVSATMML